MLSLLRSVVRQSNHIKSCLPSTTRSYTAHSDNEALIHVLDEVVVDRAAGERVDADQSWVQQGTRRKFAPSMFIRPHYWTRDHRYKGPAPFPRRPLVGPGKRQARSQDVFYQLGIDPLHEAMNATLLSAYVTEMGKIKPRTETGLTTKSQRRLGKAIRRAKMMGIIPVLSNTRVGHWQR
ncbi:ribosomal protein S18 [Hygrophoropsis aurantiaca]|uniref:Ribosomal protein S18 n=1 Tax=Hygrophoropsis aurantiaca TaxID=72124 RepID=A0ACB8ALX0_9AGAM|nr:ribosomal protein S18 [Hygrophoropsis aurantiaca]